MCVASWHASPISCIPLSFLFSLFFFRTLVHVFTAGQARYVFFLYVALLIRTLKSTLTLLSVLYLCFLFAFLFLGGDRNTFFFFLRSFVMEMSTSVQVLWSVLQWCFKTHTELSREAIRCWYAPISLELLLPETSFLSIKWKCLLGTFLLLFYFFHWCEERRVEGGKKKDWQNEKKVERVTNDRSRRGRTVQGSSARFGVWVPTQPSVKVHFFKAETWVKCATKASR